LAEAARLKKVAEMMQAATKSETRGEPNESRPPISVSPAQQPRTVPALLTELKCAAANEVVIAKARASSSASYEAARVMANSARDLWVAKAGGIELGISGVERDLLKQGGAEDELPLRFEVCE
jgi:hypothetical protein